MRLEFNLSLGDWIRAFRYDFRTFGRMFVAMAAAIVGIHLRWVIAVPVDDGMDITLFWPGSTQPTSAFHMNAAGVPELLRGLDAARDMDELHLSFPAKTYREPPEVVIIPRWAVASLARQLRREES